MKNFRKVCRGEGGFTLIELLVVIVILGVLAAVATLAVTKFIGKGNLEAAKAELSTAQTAVQAAYADVAAAGGTQFDAAVTAWDGTTTNCPTYTGTSTIRACDYLSGGAKQFKGRYNVDRNGNITGATANSWSGITWDNTTGTWIKS